MAAFLSSRRDSSTFFTNTDGVNSSACSTRRRSRRTAACHWGMRHSPVHLLVAWRRNRSLLHHAKIFQLVCGAVARILFDRITTDAFALLIKRRERIHLQACWLMQILYGARSVGGYREAKSHIPIRLFRTWPFSMMGLRAGFSQHRYPLNVIGKQHERKRLRLLSLPH